MIIYVPYYDKCKRQIMEMDTCAKWYNGTKKFQILHHSGYQPMIIYCNTIYNGLAFKTEQDAKYYWETGNTFRALDLFTLPVEEETENKNGYAE